MKSALIRTLATLAGLFLASNAVAQLAPPNGTGVALGHIHLVVSDVEAQKKFWTSMGGAPVQNGPLSLIQFPGVFIMLRKGEPSGGSTGSVVNHIGFKVRSMAELRAKIESMMTSATSNAPTQLIGLGPDNVRVEFHEEDKLSVPIAFEHVHLHVPAAAETQAWYVKIFGAAPVKDRWEVASIPGGDIRINKADATLAGTKGRSLDHIGFEVKNIEEFGTHLQSQGMKFDAAPRQVANSTAKVAFFTDPWGTYIEVTEKLAPPK